MSQNLKDRTKLFAINVVRLVKNLNNSTESKIIAHQIMRSGTSTAANYRAACRARSKTEFASKLGIVLEESDETAFWLELIVDLNLIEISSVQSLLKEANELVSIIVASIKSVKR